MAKARLLLDPTEQQKADAVKMADLSLSRSDHRKVIYSKFESTSSMVSDTQHVDDWQETFTAHPRIALHDGIDESVVEDDGIILTFAGDLAGVFCQHPDSRAFMAEEEAEDIEEQVGIAFPRFNRWDFRLVSAILTDGPERRERLSRSAEEQRMDSESHMLTKMEDVFSRLLAKMDNPQEVNVAEALGVTKKELEPEQIKAMAELAEIEVEMKQDDIAAAKEAEEDKKVARKGK